MKRRKRVKNALTAFLMLAFIFGHVAAVSASQGNTNSAASGTQTAAEKSSNDSAGKVVYLDAAQDGVGGDGSAVESAVKTLKAAYEALAGGDGTIVVCGNLSVTTCKDGKTSPFSATSGNVCFTGKDPVTGVLYNATITIKDSATVKDKDYLPFFTATTFEYLTFDARSNYSAQFVTGPSLTFGEGMSFLRNGEMISGSTSDEIVVRLGAAASAITAKYTQLSGTISSVYGGNEWQKVGNADDTQGSEITISGTAAVLVRLECGGNKKYVSQVDLTIDGSARVGTLNFSGYSNGDVKNVNVVINGGTIDTIFSQRESNNNKTNAVETLNVTVGGKPVFGDIDLSRGLIKTANLILAKNLKTDMVLTGLDENWSSVTLGENVKLQLTGNAPVPAPGKVTMENGSILYLHHATEPTGIVKNGTAKVVVVSHTGHSLTKKAADCGFGSTLGNIEYWYCADSTCLSYGLRYLDEAGSTPVSLAAAEVIYGHTLSFVEGVEANCTRAGVTEHYHCEVCGKNFADNACQNELTTIVIPQESHEMTMVDKKAPTCTEDGVRYKHWHCSKCNWNYKDQDGTEVFTFSVVEPKTGHGKHLKKVEAIAASCTQDGVIAHWACEVCGKFYTDALYDNSRLELSAEQVIDKSYHVLKKSETVAPTENAHGSIEYWYCDTEGCANYGRLFADAEGKNEITDKNSLVIPMLSGAVKTGDSFPVIPMLLLAMLGVAGIVTLLIGKKSCRQ